MKAIPFFSLLLPVVALGADTPSPITPQPPVDGMVADAAPESPPEEVRGAIVPEKIDESEDGPVPVPDLKHYGALWERSLFTTHELPAPAAPAGPSFADQLVLAGVYEADGALTAVILDMMTSQVSEVRIGSQNENGLRIKTVSPEKDRIQLQKGNQFGWVSFADAGGGAIPSAAPPVAAAPALSTRAPSPATTPVPAGATRGLQPQSSPPAVRTTPTPPTPLPLPPDISNPPVVIDDLPLPPQ